MGQRFSELKGFFGAMESRESSLPANNAGNMLTNHDDSYEQVISGNDRGRLTVDMAMAQSSINGNNAEGVDHHFESIYSNCAETSKNEEKNGNIEQAASIYSCTCPSKMEEKYKNDNIMQK